MDPGCPGLSLGVCRMLPGSWGCPELEALHTRAFGVFLSLSCFKPLQGASRLRSWAPDLDGSTCLVEKPSEAQTTLQAARRCRA